MSEWRVTARIRCLVPACHWAARGGAEILGATFRHYTTDHSAADRRAARIVPGTIRRPPIAVGTSD